MAKTTGTAETRGELTTEDVSYVSPPYAVVMPTDVEHWKDELYGTEIRAEIERLDRKSVV